MSEAAEDLAEPAPPAAAAGGVLARKLGGGGAGRSPIAEIDAIGDAFSRLLEDRLRGALRTIVGAMILDCGVRRLSRVLEEVPVPAMIGVVDAEGAEDRALAVLSNDLVFHVVDLLLGGDAEEAPTPTARAITAIDEALAGDVAHTILACFTDAVRTTLDAPAPALSLSRFEQQVTTLRIAPDGADVLLVRVGLDIGEAARTGNFDLVIPLAVLDVIKNAATGAPRARAAARSRDLWAAHMSRVAAAAPVRMRAVLHRAPMQMAELRGLRAGQVLTIPASRRGEVELTIDGPGQGGVIAKGRLGALEGAKAIKIAEPPDPALAESLRRLIAEDGS